MTASVALRFDNVVKDYKTGWLGRQPLRALDHVSLEVAKGHVVGLLGPNRAGKTTLIKLLLSLSRPTEGKIERLGESLPARTTLASVGYVHENQAFPRYLSAASLLEYYGALTMLPRNLVRSRATKLLERVGLADRAREPIARFSKGMNQRLAVAQALLNDPELLVLDEPTEGLDLEGRQMLRGVVSELKAAGKTVLYVSHVLSELEPLCDQAAVLVGGKLAYFGALEELKKREGATTLEAALAKFQVNAAPSPQRVPA